MKREKNSTNPVSPINRFTYLLIPFLLLIPQILFSFNSLNQIRYEELAESVRNVYWLSQRSIYDGVSSNVGWYGTLLILYNLFGFQLFLAKFYRLFLQFISLLCLTFILKKYLGAKKAIIPLITIGLSPTLLYFNILQTSFGLDLQYLPICIYLISTINNPAINNKQIILNYLKLALFGIISMIAWMTYPTFFFYLPALLILLSLKINKSEDTFFERPWEVHSERSERARPPERKKRYRAFLIIIGSIAFLLPFLITLFWMKNPSSLLYDPITKRGLFRGSGSIQFDAQLFSAGIQGSLKDLFEKGTSYYFEVQNVEYSHIFPLLSLIIILIVSIYLLLKRNAHVRSLRLIIGLTIFTILFNLILANFTFDSSYMPGIRRNTPALAGVYVLFIIVWYFATTYKWKEKFFQIILIGACLLLTVHHLIVLPLNISDITRPSRYSEAGWFGSKETPVSSLASIVNAATIQDLRLACFNQSGQVQSCRYSEIYPAVAGSCLWNRLNCRRILGYDEKTKQYIPLSIELWENYYFQH